MGKLFNAIKFALKNKKELLKLKDELWDLKVKSSKALMDKKIDKSELVDLLREFNDVIEVVIEIAEKE